MKMKESSLYKPFYFNHFRVVNIEKLIKSNILLLAMREEEAQALLDKYLKEKRDLPDRYKHSKEVAAEGRKIAGMINVKAGSQMVDSQLVYILGLVHDIGHAIDEGNIVEHVLEGQKELIRHGHPEIAKSIGTHYATYEGMLFDRGEDNPIYLPETIEEKVLAYADLHVMQGGEHVSVHDRLRDIYDRWQHKQDIIRVTLKAHKRFTELVREINSLAGIEP